VGSDGNREFLVAARKPAARHAGDMDKGADMLENRRHGQE
jgi:hypothetical protein